MRSASSKKKYSSSQDKGESDAKIEIQMNGSSKNTKSDLKTKTKGKSESKERRRKDDKGEKSSEAILPSKGGKRDSARKPIKPEEIQKFDVLLPNKRTCDGESSEDLYAGYTSFRKLTDRLRPLFLEHDASERRMEIAKWLVRKVTEKSGRFLKDVEDGYYKVMSFKESMQFTMEVFQNNPSWTLSAAPFVEGSKDQSLPSVQSSSGVRSAKQLPEQVASSEQDSAAIAPKMPADEDDDNTYASEPPLKRSKFDAVTPHESSPLTLTVNTEQDQTKKLLQEQELRESSVQFQKYRRERHIILAELLESKEVFMMRKERVERLETELWMFQDSPLFLRSDKWLAERVLRREEISANRELLGIQLQRCRRLQALLELNEKQMSDLQEQQKLIAAKNEQGQSKEGSPLETDSKTTTNGEKAIPHGASGKTKAAQSTPNTSVTTRTLSEAEIIRQQNTQFLQQNITTRLIDRQLAIDAEMKRRAILGRRAKIEYAIERKESMEQELQYRQAMRHAIQRQAAMQTSMEARQLMMSMGDQAVRSPPETTEVEMIKRFDCMPKEACHTTPSSRTGADTKTNEIGGTIELTADNNDNDHDYGVRTISSEGAKNQDVAEGGGGGEEDDTDDDDDEEFLII